MECKQLTLRFRAGESSHPWHALGWGSELAKTASSRQPRQLTPWTEGADALWFYRSGKCQGNARYSFFAVWSLTRTDRDACGFGVLLTLVAVVIQPLFNESLHRSV